MNKILAIAEKSIKETIRQPKVLAITLGLPVVFLAIFAFAFGGGDEGNEIYNLGVINEDAGPLGDEYVAGLIALEYDDGTQLLRVGNETDHDRALRLTEQRGYAMIVVIPADFSEGLAPTEVQQPGAAPVIPGQTTQGPPTGTSLRMLGDPTFSDYSAVSAIVESYTRAFAEGVTRESTPIEVRTEPVISRDFTQFDIIAPGLMIFAILNLVPAAAATLARESESGTLDRVRQSPTRAWELLGGVTLAQMAIASISMALMLGAAALFGFHNQGSYLLAYAIALGAAVGSVGIGMVIAALSKKQDEAANIATLFSVPASFLSGAFFQLPEIRVFDWGDRTIGLYDILPTTHAVDAMRQVLTFGRGSGEILFSLGALAVLGVAFFAVGVGLYRRTRLAPA